MSTNCPAVRTQTSRQSKVVNEVNRVQVQAAHQQAVNALVEMSLSLCGLDAPRTYPQIQIPALFRAAIREQRFLHHNPYSEEAAILETALALLEHPSELEEFCSALAFWIEGNLVRVKYDPENVTVN
jgi:hypothetical protein